MRKALIFISLIICMFVVLTWFLKVPTENVEESLSKQSATRNSLSQIVVESSESIDHESGKVKNDNQFDHYINTLATVEDLQHLTEEEVHQTPEVIIQGGEVIGRIHDEAERNPEKRVDAMDFFKKCAEDHQVVTALRAVCLNKIYRLIPVWQIPVLLSDELIEKDLTDLALRIP